MNRRQRPVQSQSIDSSLELHHSDASRFKGTSHSAYHSPQVSHERSAHHHSRKTDRSQRLRESQALSLPESGVFVPRAQITEGQRLSRDLEKLSNGPKHGVRADKYAAKQHTHSKAAVRESGIVQHATESKYLPKESVQRPSHFQASMDFPNKNQDFLESPDKQVSFGESGGAKSAPKFNAFHTGRYPKNVRDSVRQRLAIESWMDRVVEGFYSSAEEDHSCEMDVDDLLDLESDQERRAFVQEKVADAKQPPGVVDRFINELLEKLKTL